MARLRRALLAWYRRERRDLPWRRTDDPYRIWLSETMLQQTRVDTVIPYYERFLERFPSVDALACADEQDVLKEWAGLGYYARARNLKRAAEQIVRDHGSRVPSEASALEGLPGVGRYTSGAVRSIAFGEHAPIVDGNVKRVLARLTAEAELGDAENWDLAEALVPPSRPRGRPDQFNQALMELGATVCTPRSPRCTDCPVRSLCRAAERGTPEAFPRPARRASPREVEALGAIVSRRGRLLLTRRPSKGMLGGLWEVPCVGGDSLSGLVAEIERRTGLRTRDPRPVGSVRHAFTHRALTLRVVSLQPEPGRLRRASRDAARFCSSAEVADLPLSVLMRKTLALAGR
ncbi:MAG: A/G-specific adenine glycosylase [Deltaproteobacteria bacterium]|nr:A/G-specific adenine glycosylase [Deltaproteobacteria bacterium]